MEINTKFGLWLSFEALSLHWKECQNKTSPVLNYCQVFSTLLHFHHVERVHERGNGFWWGIFAWASWRHRKCTLFGHSRGSFSKVALYKKNWAFWYKFSPIKANNYSSISAKHLVLVHQSWLVPVLLWATFSMGLGRGKVTTEELWNDFSDTQVNQEINVHPQ